jgi:hypothetical protein
MCIKLDRRLLHMCLHPVSRLDRAFQRLHHHHSRHDFMLYLISQHLQHVDMILFSPRLLQYPPCMAHYYRICRDNDCRLAAFRIVDFATIYFLRFRGGGFEDVVERAELVREVFGEFGRADVNVC